MGEMPKKAQKMWERTCLTCLLMRSCGTRRRENLGVCQGREGRMVKDALNGTAEACVRNYVLTQQGRRAEPARIPANAVFYREHKKNSLQGDALQRVSVSKKLPRMSLRCRSRWRRRSLTDAGSPLAGRSEATWQSHAGSFEFAKNHLKIKTILRDCHGPCRASQ